MASALVGLASLWVGRRRSGLSFGLVATLGILFVMISLQLLPLSQQQLTWLTPHAIPIISARDLTIASNGLQSHPLTIDRYQTLLGLVFFACFSLLMVGTSRILTRETTQRLLGALVVLGIVVAFVGIVQKATSSDKIYGLWSDWQGKEPFGPFVNKNHFAGWMLMAIPASLGYLIALVNRGIRGTSRDFRSIALWFSTPEASKALLTAFSIIIMTLALVLTLSRSGIASLGVAFLIFGWTMTRQSGTFSRMATMGFFLILMIAVPSWAGIDRLVARFSAVELDNINERPAIWADTITVAKDFWLTGTGLNTFGVSMLFYQTAAPDYHNREAHNDYLQLVAEGGLMLGIPILVVIWTFGRTVRQRFRNDVGSVWWFRMGAVTGLVAVAFQSMVEFSLQMPGNAALFAVLAGIALHDNERSPTTMVPTETLPSR
jgi:hypothetical protein